MHQSPLGQVVLEITCADCADLLNKMQKERINATNIINRSGLNLQIAISGYDYRRLVQLVEKTGGSVQIEQMSNICRVFRKIKTRPISLFIVLFLILISIWLPKRVLFITVDGNTTIPTNHILAAAEKCGLYCGISRRSIRSEVIKNALLQEMPRLQWAGVNTKGCIATISVREKTTQEIQKEQNNQVCSIVAARDGIIQNCTVYKGNQLCTVGQVVKSGQILVSAYTDCGTIVKATRANAEVRALTFRNFEILTPKTNTIRSAIVSQITRHRIRIGKKVINLSKDSGNMVMGCGKIYTEKFIYLPGGFKLPIVLIRETIIYYDDINEVVVSSEDSQWLEEFAREHIKESMIAGDIVSAQTELIDADGFAGLRGQFACIEIIGQIKYEQMLLKD